MNDEGANTIAHHTFTKERQPHPTSKLSYSLISHPGKIMCRVILTQLKTKAEELLAEEPAGFRSGLRTVEQIFNREVIIEKHLQHQHDLAPSYPQPTQDQA